MPPGLLTLEVHAFAQFLARLEMWHVLGRNMYFIARLWIAPHARRAVVQAETTKTADLDPMALGQTFRHGVQDHFHRKLGIACDQLRKMCRQLGYQLRLGHSASYCAEFLLSSLALSKAPRLMVPAFDALSDACFCMASDSSAASLALIERLMLRFLRSILMIIALTLSPSFRWALMSSTRSRASSEARRYPSMSTSSWTTAPLASIDFT